MTVPSRGNFSLNSTSTGVVLGNEVQLRRPSKSFTAQVNVTASTKASFRMQGTLDGTNWFDIGAAATTFSSGPHLISVSTSNIFSRVRVKQTAMVTKTNKRSQAWISGY